MKVQSNRMLLAMLVLVTLVGAVYAYAYYSTLETLDEVTRQWSGYLGACYTTTEQAQAGWEEAQNKWLGALGQLDICLANYSTTVDLANKMAGELQACAEMLPDQ